MKNFPVTAALSRPVTPLDCILLLVDDLLGDYGTCCMFMCSKSLETLWFSNADIAGTVAHSRLVSVCLLRFARCLPFSSGLRASFLSPPLSFLFFSLFLLHKYILGLSNVTCFAPTGVEFIGMLG